MKHWKGEMRRTWALKDLHSIIFPVKNTFNSGLLYFFDFIHTVCFFSQWIYLVPLSLCFTLFSNYLSVLSPFPHPPAFLSFSFLDFLFIPFLMSLLFQNCSTLHSFLNFHIFLSLSFRCSHPPHLFLPPLFRFSGLLQHFSLTIS